MTELALDTDVAARPDRHVGVRAALSSPRLGSYLGLALVVLGFGALAYTWTRVSVTVDVGLQIPYVISGGFVGLGMIMSGLLLVTLNARRQDAVERARQSDQLIDVLADLGDRLDRIERRS